MVNLAVSVPVAAQRHIKKLMASNPMIITAHNQLFSCKCGLLSQFVDDHSRNYFRKEAEMKSTLAVGWAKDGGAQIHLSSGPGCTPCKFDTTTRIPGSHPRFSDMIYCLTTWAVGIGWGAYRTDPSHVQSMIERSRHVCCPFISSLTELSFFRFFPQSLNINL